MQKYLALSFSTQIQSKLKKEYDEKTVQENLFLGLIILLVVALHITSN